jgi:signal transduction histidine kinase
MTSDERAEEPRPQPVRPLREAPGLGRRVSRALASLKAIENDLGSGSDAVVICQTVARAIGALLTADVVVVSGYASGGENALPVASYTSAARPINPRLVDLGLAAMQLKAAPPGSLLRFDTSMEHDGLSDGERRYLRRLGVAQTLVIPLVRHRRQLGRVDVLLVQPLALGQVELDLCLQAAGQAATALALSRAQATEAEAGSAELMLRVSEALRQAQPGSPSELLQVVVSLLPRVVNCDRCYAYLWHAERNEFLPAAVNGMSEDQVATLKQHPMNPQAVPLFEQMIYSTRPVTIEDARLSTMLLPNLVQLLETRALLALPLRGRRQAVLGALMLDYHQGDRHFTPTQIALAARVAEQVSAMVETASLYEEVSQRSDRLAVLNEIGLDLASLTDLPAVFPELHAKLATVIDASALFCLLSEPDAKGVTIYHMADADLAVREHVDPGASPMLARIFAEGQGRVLHDGAASLLTGLLGPDGGPSAARSLICVPMRVRDQRVIGALAAYSTFLHAYSQQDLELLSTVASQIAVAVDNARLYAQVHAKGELRGHLLDRILSAHELERKSIVDDIHDDSLQAMVSSMYKIDLCLRLSETHNHQRELEELRNVRANLAANVDRLRTLIFEIRPSTLDYLGLLPTLDDYLARLEETTGIKPTFRSELGARLDSGLETLIYRLLQELLSNVRQHARASAVLIELRRVPDGVRVLVEDNGVGFNVQEVMGATVPSRGIGLAAVNERAQVAGGSVVVESTPGVGTRVVIVLPMTAGQHITGPLDESRVARDSLSASGGA